MQLVLARPAMRVKHVTQRITWKLQGVLQYVILRPVMTAIATIAQLVGVYGEGQLRFNRVYPYCAFINSASQAWALYCLVLMYQVRSFILCCAVASVVT